MANIVHYASSRCNRVTRSEMKCELHALIMGFDCGFIISDVLSEFLRINLVLKSFIDSKTVFDIIVKDGNSTERRLQVDIYALRESYVRADLAIIG